MLFNGPGCTRSALARRQLSYGTFHPRMGSIGRAIAGVHVTVVRPDLSVAGTAGRVRSCSAGHADERLLSHPARPASPLSRYGFHTGDYAYADQDGFLLSRATRRHLQVGGEKVSAKEIEDAVMQHDGESSAPVSGRSSAGNSARCLYRVATRSVLHRARAADVLRARHLSGARCRGRVLRRRAAQDGQGQGAEVPADRSRGGAAPPALAPADHRPMGLWGPEAIQALPFPSRFSVQVNAMRDAADVATGSPTRCASPSRPNRCASSPPARAQGVVAVDDITRPTPSPTCPGLLLRAPTIPAEDVKFLVALGAHRPMVRAELERKLGTA